MILEMTEKVPHVDGKSSELMNELMEGMRDEGEGRRSWFERKVWEAFAPFIVVLSALGCSAGVL